MCSNVELLTQFLVVFLAIVLSRSEPEPQPQRPADDIHYMLNQLGEYYQHLYDGINSYTITLHTSLAQYIKLSLLRS